MYRLKRDKEAREQAKKKIEEEKIHAAKNLVNAPAINNEFIGKIIANKGSNLDNILNPILGVGANSGDSQN
jgi:hypothetical protein